MWMDVKYLPGELKVVAYDDNGNIVQEQKVYTAGQPYAIHLEADRCLLEADGEDICFITATVVDKAGNLCPDAALPLDFKVSGKGEFKAVCNGDATSLEMFHKPTMKTFSGKLVVLVQALQDAGTIKLTVKGKGLKTASVKIQAD